MEDIENYCSFSDSPCTLDPSCSSSSFEWSVCSDGTAVAGGDYKDEEPSGAAVEPYLYDREASESSSSAGDSSSEVKTGLETRNGKQSCCRRVCR